MKLKPGGKIALILIVAGAAWYAATNLLPASVKEKVPMLAGKPAGSGGGSGGSGGGAGGGGGDVLGRPLRVALNYWPGFAGGIMANGGFKANKDSLYWKNHNLQVEFIDIEIPDQMTKALTAGAPEGVDVMWQTTDTWPSTDANLRKAKVNARAFLQADWSQGGDAIVASERVRKIEDLVGKRIGLITLSPSHSLLEEAMRDSSLEDGQRKQIEAGLKGFDDPSAIVKAFRAGQLDVAITWEPNVTEALKRPGAHRLLDSGTANKVIGDIFVAKEDFIRKNPKAIKAFVDGWFEGVSEATRNPSETIQTLKASMPPLKDMQDQEVAAMMSKIRLATLSDNTELFGLDGKEPLFDKIYDRFAKVWFELGAIPNIPPAQGARDTTALGELFAATPVPVPPQPSFKPVEATTPTKPAIMTKRLTIHFATGSAGIQPSSAAALAELSGMATRIGNAYLRIEGNTDNTGSRDLNVRLSKIRAQAVANHLVGQGFDRNRFIVVGNGPDKPVAPNSSEAGRSRNRRTDIRVVPK